MTKNISSRDWEALSAYLDGYLSKKERQRLEERLQQSMELKNGLEELRRTRRVLRSQPKMRAPRNFMLTADMVGAKATSRSTPRFFPVMRLASVLASILLVLVVVGDLLTAPIIQTAQLDGANRAVEEAATQAPEAGEEEMPAAVPEAQRYSEKALEPEATANAGIMMMAAPTEEAQGAPAEPPSGLTSPSGGGGPSAEGQATDTAAVVAPTETSPPTEELMPAPIETPTPTAPSGRIYWRTAEILLALIAVTSGLIALYLRLSSSG
jgi:anti-sigma factor RsiW